MKDIKSPEEINNAASEYAMEVIKPDNLKSVDGIYTSSAVYLATEMGYCAGYNAAMEFKQDENEKLKKEIERLKGLILHNYKNIKA